MRLLHTADWHWGAPSMHPICRSKFVKAIAKLAKENSCDYVLIAGDIFDQPNPKQQVKDLLARQLLDVRDLYPDIFFVFSVGNHDYTTKDQTYHSLVSLQLLNEAAGGDTNFFVLEPGEKENVGGLAVYVMRTWDDIPKKGSGQGFPFVLMWHGMVPGLAVTDLSEMTSIAKKNVDELLKVTGADYLALGDIHQHRQLHDRCWYPGPPIQKTFADTAGAVVVTIDDGKVTTKSVELPLPKRITYDYEFNTGVDSEETIIEDVLESVPPGNLIKLKFQLPLSVWANIDTQRIKDRLSGHYLEVALQNDALPEKRLGKELETFKKATSRLDELKTIIRIMDTDLDKKKLFKLCRRYVTDD